MNIVTANFLDFNDIHPNLQTQLSIQWARTVCMKYHLGHKTKKNRKKYFLEPVYLFFQEGIEVWKMDEDEIAIAAGAPSGADACVELGIRQKSVGDVHLMRKEASKRKATVLNPRCDPAKFRKID